MRLPGLPFSVLVHTVAIGAAVVAGGVALARPLRVPPRVELQSTVAAAPAPPPTTAVPPVVAEDSPDLPEPAAPDVVRDVQPPPEATPEAGAVAPRPPVPWRERVVRRDPPVATPPAPVAEPVPPAAAPAAAPSARVDARPLADNAPPEYPANERALGREGEVVVLVRLDEQGAVLDLELARPSPYAGLNRAALRAVRSWRFAPARQDGVAVASELEVPIVFRLVAQ